ncbi:beta-lactamase family protein [bacterium]|nr:beta-lactamase family protein [bacterium]
MTPLSKLLPRTASVLTAGTESGLHIGGQLYVAHGGRVVADVGWGSARAGVPMSNSTLLPWLSCSKPLGAAALALLVERGHAGWDDPVSRHVPEFGRGGKQAITLRHLLTHTTGLPARYEPAWWGRSRREIMAELCGLQLSEDAVPGQQTAYNLHVSWYVLAEVVGRVTGQPYGHVLREQIFRPLGIEDSWLGMPRAQYDRYGTRVGILHNTVGGACQPHPWDNAERCAAAVPGGGVYGPVRDLGRFYDWLLLARAKQVDAPRLAPATVANLTHSHGRGVFDETLRHRLNWGLGLVVDSNEYGPETVPYGFGRHCSAGTFGHGGARSSSAFADPESGVVVAWVCNGTPGEARHNERCRMVNSAIYEDLGLAPTGPAGLAAEG